MVTWHHYLSREEHRGTLEPPDSERISTHFFAAYLGSIPLAPRSRQPLPVALPPILAYYHPALCLSSLRQQRGKLELHTRFNFHHSQGTAVIPNSLDPVPIDSTSSNSRLPTEALEFSAHLFSHAPVLNSLLVTIRHCRSLQKLRWKE